MKFFLLLIALGIIIRMISNFILPFFAGSATNDKLRQMQDQMKNMNNRMNDTAQPRNSPNVKKEGDYIDYEEVK